MGQAASVEGMHGRCLELGLGLKKHPDFRLYFRLEIIKGERTTP